jgi:Zn-dependent protease
MILQFLNNPAALVALLSALLIGLTVHEYAHARVAYQLGDLTAYMAGRLTLNPMAHIDPLGALVLLMAGFGWAKPVPIDPYRLSRRDVLLVAIAGPVSNVILAALALLPVRFGLIPADGLMGAYLVFFGYLNIVLAVFNMLPIAPLDGWKVLLGVVPADTAFQLQRYEPFGPMVLLVLLVAGRVGGMSPLSRIMDPFINGLLLLLGGTGLVS